MCASWITFIDAPGALIAISANLAIGPPLGPVKEMTVAPIALATDIAILTLFAFPEVEIPNKTSSGFSKAYASCAKDISLNDESFSTAVFNDELAPRAIAGNPTSRLFAKS